MGYTVCAILARSVYEGAGVHLGDSGGLYRGGKGQYRRQERRKDIQPELEPAYCPTGRTVTIFRPASTTW